MKRKKILIIEDDNLFRTVLKDVLLMENYEVIEASCGSEGLERIKEIPDIVLLDWEMPKMSGLEVLKKIREDPYFSSIPIIFLTGMSEEEKQIQVIDLGADDYILKPLNIEILLAKIKILIRQRELRLSVNPLTNLPGNVSIQQEVETKLLKDVPFVLFYIDLNNFKAYNDYYGFKRGDDIIKHLSKILVSSVKEWGEKNDFIGHIGGDDFVIISSKVEGYNKIAEEIIKNFDNSIKDFYNEEDLKRGFITVTNRENKLQDFPIMSVVITVIPSWKTKILNYEDLAKRASELKKYAKSFNKSIFVEERRK